MRNSGMIRALRYAFIGIAVTVALQGSGDGQEIGSPEGIKSEQSLPSRYGYVVEDMLKYCRPTKGFWIDLGAGKGQVATHGEQL